ncbi:chemotaxis response regulator protein-glutamate methylesterase [Paenibacillus sp. NPDC058071]|uniref:protein-glutamate methylesterase/protein-glutamine glutaminase n=1 Tax=Paenibacillus sp. NPDC058071 TaxID=3346326 RepID=UPI0036D9CBFA
MAPYRILVVDDSPFMRKIFSDFILQDEQFTIAGTAANGLEAIQAVETLKPDAITLDLEMPEMNGIDALQIIMKRYPLPVIMLSGISEENTRETIKALQYGAFDFIRKPSGANSNDIVQVSELLLEKLTIAVLTKRHASSFETREPDPDQQLLRLKREQQEQRLQALGEALEQAKEAVEKPVKPAAKPLSKPQTGPLDKQADKQGESKSRKRDTTTPLTGGEATFKPLPERALKRPAEALPPARTERQKQGKKLAPPSEVASVRAGDFRHIIAIGTSTGGPRALHEVISSLPAGLPAPVLVVQHMPPKFTKSLAQRLDSFSALQVVEATQGERLQPGVVYVAPGGYHLEVARDANGYSVQLNQQPPRNGHRPSVDVLFESLVPYQELKRHAVIMTGMGSDGAKGMKLLAESGAESTIAESEETCVVYGMPRCAVEAGAASVVLPLNRIASELGQLVTKS